ncbi:hypothetical protein [Actinoallomurus iriomotensis]|uniref:Uncharacterized protein n=1 Tax=Actinoallomurus iriomotensis TaxID=478107 RepID=A0A9W6RAS2_9ACTN|nr:hypothetical protein [Actinoallomurus iriomotensis]GLY72163.1 hypothetical protein Airi01_004300 [Actinoallomurus iriomotensis]
MIRRVAVATAGDLVFDPALPAAMLADVRSGSGELLVTGPGTPPGSHRFRRQRVMSGALTWCVVIVSVGTLEHVTGGWWAWPAGVLGALTFLPWNAVDRRRDREPVVAGSVAMLFPWALFPGLAGLAVCAFLLLMVYAGFVADCGGGTTHVVGRDRVVSLADLDEAERARLSRVRAARERVEEAQRLLTPGFDGTLVLTALREEEWGLATRMREMTPHAAEAAGRADETVIELVEQYVRPVERAIQAHREWERIQRAAGGDEAHAGLLARAEAGSRSEDTAEPSDLDGDLTLEAARRACEELTAEAMRANVWLLNALHGGEEDDLSDE